MLTHERLKEVLDYSIISGRFYWKNSGKIAGTKLADGRIQIQVDKRLYKAHRLAWLFVTGEWPKNVIDHRNRNYTFNAFLNLRDATLSENQQNVVKARKHNSTGLLGVSYDKSRNLFASKIRVDNKYKFLGRFQTAEEAHSCYMNAKRELHPFFEEINV